MAPAIVRATMNVPQDPAELVSMLRWYQAAGVDVAVSETPQNRYAEPAQKQAKNAPVATAPKQTVAPTTAAPTEQVAPAAEPPDFDAVRETVAACTTMDALKQAYGDYDGCALKQRATQLVFADGNPEADIMLIGEAPGQEEDLQGKPFVGRAGQLLDRMLAAIGLDRDKVFIANTVAWRPPGNRNPTPLEIAACRPFLDRQVQLCAPRLVMSLGLVATQTLFDENVSITRARGKWRDVAFGDYAVPVLPTLHPAFLLRQPRQKRAAWEDLLTLKSAIAALDGSPAV